MNESYTSFAQVYDMFMDKVDYPAWSKYLIQLLKEYQVEDGLDIILTKMVTNENGEVEYIPPTDKEFEAVAEIYEKM